MKPHLWRNSLMELLIEAAQSEFQELLNKVAQGIMKIEDLLLILTLTLCLRRSSLSLALINTDSKSLKHIILNSRNIDKRSAVLSFKEKVGIYKF
jgi:hypothetical protein